MFRCGWQRFVSTKLSRRGETGARTSATVDVCSPPPIKHPAGQLSNKWPAELDCYFFAHVLVAREGLEHLKDLQDTECLGSAVLALFWDGGGVCVCVSV